MNRLKAGIVLAVAALVGTATLVAGLNLQQAAPTLDVVLNEMGFEKPRGVPYSRTRAAGKGWVSYNIEKGLTGTVHLPSYEIRSLYLAEEPIRAVEDSWTGPEKAKTKEQAIRIADEFVRRIMPKDQAFTVVDARQEAGRMAGRWLVSLRLTSFSGHPVYSKSRAVFVSAAVLQKTGKVCAVTLKMSRIESTVDKIGQEKARQIALAYNFPTVSWAPSPKRGKIVSVEKSLVRTKDKLTSEDVWPLVMAYTVQFEVSDSIVVIDARDGKVIRSDVRMPGARLSGGN